VSYLARFLAHPDAWADLIDDLDKARENRNCKLNVLFDVFDVNGGAVSFFEIDPNNCENVRRVAGAYIATQKKFRPLSIKYVDTSALAQLGIKAKREPSTCPDEEIGKNAHYNLIVSDFEQAFGLAVAMAPTGIKFNNSEVAECILNSMRHGRYKLEKLKPELVHQMMIEGFIRIPGES
jgi:hypothetical protein